MIRPLIALLLLALPVQARDGASVFQARCASCHAIAAGGPKLPGPNLTGVAGRVVAGDPNYDYSPALRAARDEGRRWTEAGLRAFLEDPEDMFPGLWMGGNGLKSADDRAAVADFLSGLSATGTSSGR